jgi:hypothetical protein
MGIFTHNQKVDGASSAATTSIAQLLPPDAQTTIHGIGATAQSPLVCRAHILAHSPQRICFQHLESDDSVWNETLSRLRGSQFNSLAIIGGEQGSGKTTLARAMHNFHRPNTHQLVITLPASAPARTLVSIIEDSSASVGKGTLVIKGAEPLLEKQDLLSFVLSDNRSHQLILTARESLVRSLVYDNSKYRSSCVALPPLQQTPKKLEQALLSALGMRAYHDSRPLVAISLELKDYLLEQGARSGFDAMLHVLDKALDRAASIAAHSKVAAPLFADICDILGASSSVSDSSNDSCILSEEHASAAEPESDCFFEQRNSFRAPPSYFFFSSVIPARSVCSGRR